MDLFEKYKRMNIDGHLISLDYREIDQPYFCYPVNAKVIGFEENILYCFISEYQKMVFASNPDTCADSNVYPLAKNFEDFLRLIIACGSANPIEQIVWMNKEQFEKHIKEEKKHQSQEQIELLKQLEQELDLLPMENPFEYVKKIQSNFDSRYIQYSDEYYEVLGLENPNKPKTKQGFEFEPVIFKFEKQ